ncbi:MAG TPA: ABC transporter permease [Clostridiales bacterium]|nr:ABC transporter permease [Clostridiales bacterium]
MYKIFIVLKYKLKILLSDKSFLIAMTFIPLFLTLITGYALKYEEENKIPVAICDLDNTDYSKSIIERISAKEGFKFILTDEKTALKLVKDYKAEAAYIIKKGFKENLLSGNTGGLIEQVYSPSTISSDIISEVIGSEVARIMLNTTAADWVVNEYNKMGILKDPKIPKDPKDSKDSKTQNNALWQEAWEYTDSLWDQGPVMGIEYGEIDSTSNGTAGKNKNLPGNITSSAFGMLVAFVMFLIMFNSSWLIDEKENGTLRRIISGSGALNALFAGNILSLLFVGTLQIIFFSLICTIVFGVNIFSQGINVLIIILYLLSVIGISLFISSLLKTRMQLQAGAPLFSIITAFLGGCFWSFKDMGGLIKIISLLTPQGLALDLFTKYSASVSGISFMTAAGILMTSWQAIALLITAIALTSFSYFKIKLL